MAANYNNSAWFYDSLAKLVYGRTLINAQVYLLQFVSPDANILIAGGGTGWILEELTHIYRSGLTITYVEVAANMMALSRKRNVGANQVNFITDAIENVALPGGFDVIITPFLFDNFTDKTLQKVFKHLHSQLKPGGLWLNTHFQLTGKWWQNLLLKTMFAFFKLVCHIEASALPDIEKQFVQNNYSVVIQKTFFGEFITAKTYRK